MHLRLRQYFLDSFSTKTENKLLSRTKTHFFNTFAECDLWLFSQIRRQEYFVCSLSGSK